MLVHLRGLLSTTPRTCTTATNPALSGFGRVRIFSVAMDELSEAQAEGLKVRLLGLVGELEGALRASAGSAARTLMLRDILDF